VCAPPLVIELRRQGAAFAPGTYTIALSVDGGGDLVTCTISGDGMAAPCAKGGTLVSGAEVQGTVIRMQLFSAPSRVHLEVTGAVPTWSTDLTPTYRESPPSDCVPACKTATVSAFVG
jgi:hypothetical protein